VLRTQTLTLAQSIDMAGSSNLRSQKRLAASVLNAGKNKVRTRRSCGLSR